MVRVEQPLNAIIEASPTRLAISSNDKYSRDAIVFSSCSAHPSLFSKKDRQIHAIEVPGAKPA
jgi:hypothetical protein